MKTTVNICDIQFKYNNGCLIPHFSFILNNLFKRFISLPAASLHACSKR